MELLQSRSFYFSPNTRFLDQMLQSEIPQDYNSSNLLLLHDNKNIDDSLTSPYENRNSSILASPQQLDVGSLVPRTPNRVSSNIKIEENERFNSSLNEFIPSHSGISTNNEKCNTPYNKESKNNPILSSPLSMLNHKRGASMPGMIGSSQIQFEYPKNSNSMLSIKSISEHSNYNDVDSSQVTGNTDSSSNIDTILDDLKQEATKIKQKLLSPMTGNEAARLVSSFISKLNETPVKSSGRDPRSTVDAILNDPSLLHTPEKADGSPAEKTNSLRRETKSRGSPGQTPFRVDKFKLQRDFKQSPLRDAFDSPDLRRSDPLFSSSFTAANDPDASPGSFSMRKSSLNSDVSSNTGSGYYNVSGDTNDSVAQARNNSVLQSPRMSFTSPFPQYPRNAFPGQFMHNSIYSTGNTPQAAQSSINNIQSPQPSASNALTYSGPPPPPSGGAQLQNFAVQPPNTSSPATHYSPYAQHPFTPQGTGSNRTPGTGSIPPAGFHVPVSNWASPIGAMSPLPSPNWTFIADSPSTGSNPPVFTSSPSLPMPSYNMPMAPTAPIIPVMQPTEYVFHNSMNQPQVSGQEKQPQLQPIEQPTARFGGRIIMRGGCGSRKRNAAKTLKCQQCGTTQTPEWRRGPQGLRTLCNACGLFHAKITRRHGEEVATRLLKLRKPASS